MDAMEILRLAEKLFSEGKQQEAVSALQEAIWADNKIFTQTKDVEREFLRISNKYLEVIDKLAKTRPMPKLGDR